MSFQDYAALCERHQLHSAEADTLAALMRDLGQTIYYGEDEGLADFWSLTRNCVPGYSMTRPAQHRSVPGHLAHGRRAGEPRTLLDTAGKRLEDIYRAAGRTVTAPAAVPESVGS